MVKEEEKAGRVLFYLQTKKKEIMKRQCFKKFREISLVHFLCSYAIHDANSKKED